MSESNMEDLILEMMTDARKDCCSSRDEPCYYHKGVLEGIEKGLIASPFLRAPQSGGQEGPTTTQAPVFTCPDRYQHLCERAGRCLGKPECAHKPETPTDETPVEEPYSKGYPEGMKGPVFYGQLKDDPCGCQGGSDV